MDFIERAEDLERWNGCVCVLTMGALHDGHLELIRQAVRLDRGPVLVSIFVNPTQFGPNEDFNHYPRTLQNDLDKAGQAGADVVFAPSVETVYPDGPGKMPTPPLPDVAVRPGLEDAHRPDHFAGVVQVVHRFFDLIKPAAALFGEKDFQQLLVLKSMVQRESMPIEIVAVPTVREEDGLAMSSRNVYLGPPQRKRALGLYKALRAVRNGGLNSIGEAESLMRSILLAHQIQLDYAVIRDAHTLMPIDEDTGTARPLRALIAGRVGPTRLIDNMAVNW